MTTATTDADIPGVVDGLSTTAMSNSITVTWNIPSEPNGAITQYRCDIFQVLQ